MHGKFQLTITLGNEAMQTPYDLADALQKLSRRLDEWQDFPGGDRTALIRDLLGNTVGQWSFTQDEED